MSSPQALPSSLEALRSNIVGQLTTLLENHVRSHALDKNFWGHLEAELAQLGEQLKQLKGGDNGNHAQRCDISRTQLNLLEGINNNAWSNNCAQIKSLIVEFQDLIDQVSSALVDKTLFEKQGQVLEQIILSHEKVAHWQAFVQQILNDFYDIFPFKFFTIAFAEQGGISLYLYYLDSYSDELKQQAHTRLCRKMLKDLHQPPDTIVNFQDFQVREGKQINQVADMDLLTVGVPSDQTGVGGMLGVGYSTLYPLSTQEEIIIRSLLSVMVMVVGSAKTLNSTLRELEYYAEHDPLTGLYNRRYFNRLLEYEIDRAGRHTRNFSILMIDLDNFKIINDSHGHGCGDRVLRQISQTLENRVRKGDVLARLGGDEFAIILPETNFEQAAIVAEDVRKTASKLEFHSDDKSHHFGITLSLGLINFPKDATTMSELMSGADIALYQAKAEGKNSVCTLDSVKDRIALERKQHSLTEGLRNALGTNRIIPYFQPIINCEDGSIFAYEALARLKTEDGQIISAGEFIEATEKIGISLDLDRVIMKHVAENLAEFVVEHRPIPKVFINLSPQQIQHRGILQYGQTLCEEYAIPPENIIFELTERAAISNMSNVRRFLERLQKRGFSFALDDFGSGYNSFHYLRELHFDYVKLDGSFISNMLHSKVDDALVEALSGLCGKLGIATIAEFVETQEIMDRLGELGVDYAQGFHLGMPREGF